MVFTFFIGFNAAHQSGSSFHTIQKRIRPFEFVGETEVNGTFLLPTSISLLIVVLFCYISTSHVPSKSNVLKDINCF